MEHFGSRSTRRGRQGFIPQRQKGNPPRPNRGRRCRCVKARSGHNTNSRDERSAFQLVSTHHSGIRWKTIQHTPTTTIYVCLWGPKFDFAIYTIQVPVFVFVLVRQLMPLTKTVFFFSQMILCCTRHSTPYFYFLFFSNDFRHHSFFSF